METVNLLIGILGVVLLLVALWQWANDSPERRDAEQRNRRRDQGW